MAGRVGGADDERRAGLVDEDVVGLVDQGEVMAALHAWDRAADVLAAAGSTAAQNGASWPWRRLLTLSRSRRKSKPNSEAVP